MRAHQIWRVTRRSRPRLALEARLFKTKCKKLCTFVFAIPRPPPIKKKVSSTVGKALNCCTGNMKSASF